MKVMIIAPRTPWPPYTGDRLRANMWIDALRDQATVVVITPPTASLREDIEVIPAVSSATALIAGIGRTIAHGAPFHTLLTAPWNWRAALNEAGERHGVFDVAIVLLTRTDPAVFRFLTARRLILDAIDSAARGMEARAGAARSAAARVLWKWDARRSHTLEQNAATRYDDVITVAPEESAAFGAGATTIPMGVDIEPITDGDRRFDFGFWGGFRYFANREAVHTLLDTIWPEIRRRRPGSTLFLGGNNAAPWLRALDGRDGVSVHSPVADRGAALRHVRVALLPILSGTGQSLKTLEMAEAGCAIVGTSTAFRGVEALATESIIEDDMLRFAERAITLLEGDAAAAGAQLRAIVVSNHDRTRSLAMMRALVLENKR